MTERTTSKRGRRIAAALFLTTSLTSFGAMQPAMAQSNDAAWNAFGSSGYSYCDAKLVGALWGMTPDQGKIEIGQKVLGGYVENVPAILVESRAAGNRCDWGDTGLGYDDAERLAAQWQVSVGDAKTRAASYVTQGRTDLLDGILGNDSGWLPSDDQAFDAFFASRFNYCDARLLGELWGGDAATGKIAIGTKILVGIESYVPEVLQDSRNQGHSCDWDDTGHSYDDAVRLASIWGLADPWQAKLRAAQFYTAGEANIVTAALR